VLVTVLTKRMAGILLVYTRSRRALPLYALGDRTLERVRLLRDFAKGEYDVLIGINLLRGGPGSSRSLLVAILDADKEGFLRSSGSLIQTIGRAARM